MSCANLWRVSLFLAAAAVAAAADETDARLQSLEEQNRSILERLDRSEARNRELEERLESERRQMLRSEVEGYLSTQAAEGGNDADSWIRKLTRTGKLIQFYGFFRLDAYWNTARTDSVIIPTRVLPEDGAAFERNDGDFAFDARLTRFGVDIDGGEVGPFRSAKGRLEIDFANFPAGVAESRPAARIRVAYLQLERGSWTFRGGQDWDVISPLFPAVNNEMLMWNAGNLGDRRPMAEAIWKNVGANGIEWVIHLAAGLTGAVNNLDLDTPAGERDGFDSSLPHFQVRVGATGKSFVADKKWSAGVWAYYAFLETDTLFAGENEFNPYCVGADFTIPLHRVVAIRGEVWIGQALGDVRGNIGQTIHTGLGEEIAGLGGWIEVRFEPNKQWTLYVGGSIDDPDNADVPAASGSSQPGILNVAAYVGAFHSFGGGLKMGLDLIFWETQYQGLANGNMLRINFFTQYDF